MPRQKLERVLTTDPGMGVIRHADAGYERAIEVASERGVRVPMLDSRLNASMPSHIVAHRRRRLQRRGELTPLDRYLLELTGKDRPRVCFLGTASGDADRYAAKFYRAYAPVAFASDLVLFGAPANRRTWRRLGDQDLIFVGGGNTANMLAVWRSTALTRPCVSAWEAGTVLAGISAGAICWFEACLTDSFGPQLSAD